TYVTSITTFMVTTTTTISSYTPSLHVALPIYYVAPSAPLSTEVSVPGIEIKDADESLLRLLIPGDDPGLVNIKLMGPDGEVAARSEEHTSELQSRFDLVCRLLLGKNK